MFLITLKLKKRKNAVKKLRFFKRYVPNWFKTQRICDKAVVKNGATLKFVSGNYNNKTMCNQGVDNYVDVIEYVL